MALFGVFGVIPVTGIASREDAALPVRSGLELRRGAWVVDPGWDDGDFEFADAIGGTLIEFLDGVGAADSVGFFLGTGESDLNLV